MVEQKYDRIHINKSIGIKEVDLLDNEKLAVIIGVIIAIVSLFIAFYHRFDINMFIIVFLLVYIFCFLSILLVKKVFDCLKDWRKDKKL